MRFRIAQPNTQLASAAVQIQLDGRVLGTLGPGDSLDLDIPHDEHYPYKVLATCGLLWAAYHGRKDCDLQVCWSLRNCSMELRNTK